MIGGHSKAELQSMFMSIDNYLHPTQTYDMLEEKVLCLEYDNDELKDNINMMNDNQNNRGL